ncbi:hypothetical protein ABEB36_009372 [Hypothenemus hampei]|uniref:Uncharacterized protein n=1 Tax=Hypothenemus hampei TaxID=57062 RepID=A0ABD1EG52_HYPHA
MDGLWLAVEKIYKMHQKSKNSSLVSILDYNLHRSLVPETGESGNDLFTRSEIEYENANLPGHNDKYKLSDLVKSRNRNNSSNESKSNIPPPSCDSFDTLDSMNTLIASNEELESPLYRSINESTETTGLGWRNY